MSQPENADYIDIIDVEYIHHTRCSQFFSDQQERFHVLREPKNPPYNYGGGTMMFTDSYLNARAIQNYFETKTKHAAALLSDEYNDGHSQYVVLTTLSMLGYKDLIVTAESAAQGGE
jgi:hypothetical protein